ncbi:MAG: multiheme c-type cytochrome [Verrucomicrobiota bacterium]
MAHRLAALICSILGASSLWAQRLPMDPMDVMGVASCNECHGEMVDSWMTSAHFRSFESLASEPKAVEMAELLQIKPGEIAMKESCVRCHFTHEPVASMAQPTAAVSCESCHGESYNWIDEHNRKSLAREQRIETAKSVGMVHPSSIFGMTKTCYDCHVIDDEQLVNQTGHPAMSDSFEYLSWYSGEVNHNFLVHTPGKSVKSHVSELQPIPQERRRMLYVVGKLHHLSATLRALSLAEDPPMKPDGEFIRLPDGNYTYGVQHAIELQRIQQDLERLLSRVEIPEVTRVLALLRGLKLETGHSREMAEMAMQISRQTKQLAEKRNGSSLAGIDPLLKEMKPFYAAGYEEAKKALEIAKLARAQPRSQGDRKGEKDPSEDTEQLVGGEEASSEVEERMEEVAGGGGEDPDSAE